jgi:hypothetical protein
MLQLVFLVAPALGSIAHWLTCVCHHFTATLCPLLLLLLLQVSPAANELQPLL